MHNNTMKKRMFTPDQIEKMSKNKHVARCGTTSVRYGKAFKAAALKQYNEGGLSAVEIFQNAEIDLAIIGKRAPNRLMHQWRMALRGDPKQEIDPLTRPNNNLEMLRSQVAYLKAENHFLAQLRARKRK